MKALLNEPLACTLDHATTEGQTQLLELTILNVVKLSIQIISHLAQATKVTLRRIFGFAGDVAEVSMGSLKVSQCRSWSETNNTSTTLPDRRIRRFLTNNKGLLTFGECVTFPKLDFFAVTLPQTLPPQFH